MIFLYCPSITWFFISVKGMVVFVSLWTCDGKSGDPGVAVFGRGCCSNIHLSVVVVVVGFTYLLLSFHYRDYTRFLCVSVSLRELTLKSYTVALIKKRPCLTQCLVIHRRLRNRYRSLRRRPTTTTTTLCCTDRIPLVIPQNDDRPCRNH